MTEAILFFAKLITNATLYYETLLMGCGLSDPISGLHLVSIMQEPTENQDTKPWKSIGSNLLN